MSVFSSTWALETLTEMREGMCMKQSQTGELNQWVDSFCVLSSHFKIYIYIYIYIYIGLVVMWALTAWDVWRIKGRRLMLFWEGGAILQCNIKRKLQPLCSVEKDLLPWLNQRVSVNFKYVVLSVIQLLELRVSCLSRASVEEVEIMQNGSHVSKMKAHVRILKKPR